MALADARIRAAIARDNVYRMAEGMWLHLEVRPEVSELARVRCRLERKANLFSLAAQLASFRIYPWHC